MVLGMTLSSSNASEDECCERCDTQILASTSNDTSQEFPSVSLILDKMLTTPGSSRRSSYHLESKVDMVCGLLSMLGGQEHADMGETLLNLSTNPESCLAMRQSGCVPLLVQLMQLDRDRDTRNRAVRAICNVISAQPDEKIRKREIKIFRLLEEIKVYTEELRKGKSKQENCRHPLEVCIHLMKSSFDEDYRQVICLFGGIHVLANVIEAEHVYHGGSPDVPACSSLRKYICMSLTNVTFSDSGNKALLCSYRKFMRAIVVQLQSSSEELRQVSAAILRNLSWHADTASRDMLREVGAVAGLVKAAMVTKEENTLRCILSALWNLSAHSTENKAEICAIEGALGFLVDMLSYQSTSNSLAIVENAGGVLRNISSQIAVRDDYREVLRKHNCLQVLVEHLKSSNLTILNNVCGIVWNLSAKCVVDQDALIQSGTIDLLSSLATSKHKMIALSASAALRNLLNSTQKRSDARLGDNPGISALILHKHQDFIVNNIDASTICDESLFFENICEYIPMSDLKRKFEMQKKVDSKRNCCNTESSAKANELCQPFKNLNISSSQSSYRHKSNHSKPKYLPPAPKSVTSSPSTYIPVRNKFSDCGFEDEIESSEQPIDYSRKYAEVKVSNLQSEKVTKPYSYGITSNKSVKENKSSGIYAETDLDQPTDYSLQYAEDDSDSDCDKVSKNEGEEFVQDTVKTYCTEGTPYETPFNFSTATSMSDLRIESNETIDKANNKQHDIVDSPNLKLKEDNIDVLQRKSNVEIVKSSYSSGIMSPEKPVNYCDEGTPGYFSRVSSFESLTAVSLNEVVKEKDKLEEVVVRTTETSSIKGTNKITNSPAEAKVVKFEEVLNYAEETPLMFSRSSSLASLDSIEQHSIDRSSIVSDFSRRTSGVVSPSELPDSPTQMVPSIPHRSKIASFSVRRTTSEEEKPLSLNRRVIPKSTVFEDKVIKFKEENTPVHFSAATSLSSLTIDDNDETERALNMEQSNKVGENLKEDVKINQQDEVEEVRHEVNNEFEDGLLEQDEEDDDEILAACIKMGMPSKRSQKQEKSSSECDVRSSSAHSKIEGHGECLSDASCNLSEGDYKLLAECIQAGMPRSRSAIGSTSIGLKSYGNEKKFSSLKKNKNTDPTKYLQGSSSHETGLNNKAINLRNQAFLKSSCSDCSYDRLDAELSRRQQSAKVHTSNINVNNITCTNTYQVNTGHQVYGTSENKKATLSVHNDNMRMQNGISKSSYGDNRRNHVESQPKSDFSFKTKAYSFKQGRNNVHSLNPPQNRMSTKIPTGTYFSNQRVHNVNSVTRKTSIPIATPALNASLSIKNSLGNLNLGNSINIQKHDRVPPNTMNDPRLIHPALEHFDTLRSTFDKRHKEKIIAKGKRSKNLQELQRKMCLNAFVPIRDEVEKYAVENSPSYISLRSSLSDLTVDGSVAGIVSHITSRVVSPHPEESLVEELNNCENDDTCTVDQKEDLIEVVENKNEQDHVQKKEQEAENSILFFSEEEEQDDDDILLAACIQMGMRGKSLRGQTKSEISKQSSDTTANNNNASECVTPEPLVGRLETGTVNKLSFKLKDTVTKETPVTSNIGKELEIVNASTSSKENTPTTPSGHSGHVNLVSDHSSNVDLRRESLSSHSVDLMITGQIEPTSSAQTSLGVSAESSEVKQPISPKSTKRTKRSKSRRVLVEKMGKMVDLLKLRKN